MKSIYKESGGIYTLQGDYNLQNLWCLTKRARTRCVGKQSQVLELFK